MKLILRGNNPHVFNEFPIVIIGGVVEPLKRQAKSTIMAEWSDTTHRKFRLAYKL
ncbi:hypothetical protein HZS38_03135 [Xenorhabdus nematophila]|uniref:hypothetical protein n=1 Tax=Xenorhabdus nematophila TaxID=628 RepID=UPI00032754AA|nr:hypothetical protein [Xenorhabdus nematophila]CEE91696.1 hypothetical protein XNA1_2330021 [Xenorhabdus nematophila str. Anatoliense]CEF32228.1 hypothetical protein XNW1_4280011 [Xenorhabdus nematophila str. Websteri]MBA0018222.1 hypothetical protein [Xenorhabdus nematophila]MCB4424306.1 hypothetical protein [Xenorhabdus nematophila]QNJ37303.1 hypothetical protein H8F46_03480 [Xenorhabdus nematophila]